MLVKVKLFARARDLAGQETVTIEVPSPATVRDLRSALQSQVPQLEQLSPHLLVAINEDYAPDETLIPQEATIACFPPVSGG